MTFVCKWILVGNCLGYSGRAFSHLGSCSIKLLSTPPPVSHIYSVQRGPGQLTAIRSVMLRPSRCGGWWGAATRASLVVLRGLSRKLNLGPLPARRMLHPFEMSPGPLKSLSSDAVLVFQMEHFPHHRS